MRLIYYMEKLEQFFRKAAGGNPFAASGHTTGSAPDVRVQLFSRSFAGCELRKKLRELKERNDPRYSDLLFLSFVLSEAEPVRSAGAAALWG